MSNFDQYREDMACGYEDDGRELEPIDERDPDDCMDCGMCEACIAQSKAYYEEMEAQEAAAITGETCPNCGLALPCGGHEPDWFLEQIVASAYAAMVQRSLVTR